MAFRFASFSAVNLLLCCSFISLKQSDVVFSGSCGGHATAGSCLTSREGGRCAWANDKLCMTPDTAQQRLDSKNIETVQTPRCAKRRKPQLPFSITIVSPSPVLLTLWCQLLPYWYSYEVSCARPDYAIICNFWHLGTLMLRAERQSAQMSKITNDCLTRSGTGCFMAVLTSQQWAPKG